VSSEYVYDRRAVNLQGVNGTYTALFIKSHSSNTFPHNPHWWLYHLSEKPSAIYHVLRYAHTCDDGLTRGPGGSPLSGQHDIALWRKAITEASTVPSKEDAGSMASTVVFAEKPCLAEYALEVMPKFLALAASMGIALSSEPYSGSGPARHAVTIDLCEPGHIDLIWRASREIEVKPLYGDETCFMRASMFLKPIENILGSLYLPQLPSDPLAIVTVPASSKYVVPEAIRRFEFPVEGLANQTHRMLVVTDWQCNILSTRPDHWFAQRLVEIEQANPGTAESAYRKFSRLIKALPASSIEGSIAEVLPCAKKAEKWRGQRWVQDTIERFYAGQGASDMSVPLYTSTAQQLLAALNVCEYLDCKLAVFELVPAAKETAALF
jgi:hypothetical protein